MKILFIADIHAKLGAKKVPKNWQANRFDLLASAINSYETDLVVIGGDLFDSSDYSVEEFSLVHKFLTTLRHPILLFAGNHEMLSANTSVYFFLEESLKKAIPGITIVTSHYRSPDFDVIPYEVIHKANWPAAESKICFTHVRGEIPPHVKPEIDLDRFKEYSLVFAGDLHSYKNSQKNLLYPGSPMTTEFHREVAKGANGLFLIDTVALTYEWVELFLPQLIRTRVSSITQAVPDPYHHVIYEVELSEEEIKSAKPTDLVEKLIVNLPDRTVQELPVTDPEDVIGTTKEFLSKKGLPEDRLQRIVDLLYSIKTQK